MAFKLMYTYIYFLISDSLEHQYNLDWYNLEEL